MLTHLHIVNFAIVSHLDLVFDKGMTVVTGETGAGKSIMLDALGLALGDRAESGTLADDQDKAEIHATFVIADNEAAKLWLQSRELARDGIDECILRRVLSKDGRSRAYINNQPCTVQDLKSLGECLIDIHSQHEHQSLLKKEVHRQLLDNYGGQGPDTQHIAEIHDELRHRQASFAALKTSSSEQSAQLQLLSYQAEELDALNLLENESQQLEEEQKRLANAETSAASCQLVLSILADSGNPGGEPTLLDTLDTAISKIEDLDDPQLRSALELMASSRIQLQEAGYDIQRFSENFKMDPERLQEVEARLDRIYDIARKHHIQPAEIPELHNQINAELSRLENVDSSLDELRSQIDQLKSDYTKAAKILTKKRKSSLRKLAKEVSSGLHALGMKDAEFDIRLTPTANDFARHGQEDVEFVISTIKGQARKSLAKVASGGELSRISLAIQVVTANTTRVPTLVFDEVDVGIGGGIAEVVGAMLRQLGEQGQILCVTHLAQVAAQGHQHLSVLRNSKDKKTVTNIIPLGEAERVSEIARMLGGLDITDQSLAHAREMFETSQKAQA
jgi:DNA repair protein RecN (Recombination protein N)